VLAQGSENYDLAIEALCRYRDENLDFLLKLIPQDKSADKVYRLLRATIVQNMYEPPKLDRRFNVQLLRLLNDPAVEVRRDALCFIFVNPHHAEMYWVHFSPAVGQRVGELQTSSDAKEKDFANRAAEALVSLQPRLAEVDERKRQGKLANGWTTHHSKSGVEFLAPRWESDNREIEE
jgi:hypothetical protein